VVTHVALLAWFITLPRETYRIVLRQLSIPYVVVFSLATMLIGIFMESQNQRLRAEKELADSEKKYRDLITNLREGRLADE